MTATASHPCASLEEARRVVEAAEAVRKPDRPDLDAVRWVRPWLYRFELVDRPAVEDLRKRCAALLSRHRPRKPKHARPAGETKTKTKTKTKKRRRTGPRPEKLRPSLSEEGRRQAPKDAECLMREVDEFIRSLGYAWTPGLGWTRTDGASGPAFLRSEHELATLTGRFDVDQTAGPDAVKARMRALWREHHPDAGGRHEDAVRLGRLTELLKTRGLLA